MIKYKNALIICCSVFFAAGKLVENLAELSCDAEVIVGDHFFAEIRGDRLKETRFHDLTTRTNSRARSGKFGIYVNSKNPYGLSCVIKNVQPGEHFRVSCWRHKDSNRESCLIATADTIEIFYLAQKAVSFVENNWELLEMDFIIPSKTKNRDIKVFVFAANGDAYFDDIKIEYLDEKVQYPESLYSSFTDPRDSSKYKIVRIGDDWWMAENLKYQDCSDCGYYQEDPANFLQYGMLYSFSSARLSVPPGWKLPSDKDWSRLERILGMGESDIYQFGDRGNNISWPLKEFGRTGFEVKFAGAWSASYYNLERSAYFWTSTETDSLHAICREINQWSSIGRYLDKTDMRFSVRCIKINP